MAVCAVISKKKIGIIIRSLSPKTLSALFNLECHYIRKIISFFITIDDKNSFQKKNVKGIYLYVISNKICKEFHVFEEDRKV